MVFAESEWHVAFLFFFCFCNIETSVQKSNLSKKVIKKATDTNFLFLAFQSVISNVMYVFPCFTVQALQQEIAFMTRLWYYRDLLQSGDTSSTFYLDLPFKAKNLICTLYTIGNP